MRRRQLCRLLAGQQRSAAEEIRQAAYAADVRLRQIAIVKEKLDLCEERLEDLRKRRGTGGATAFDISAAKLEVIEAESSLTHQVIAWKIAHVKLKEAQGLLALECGSCLPEACRRTCCFRSGD